MGFEKERKRIKELQEEVTKLHDIIIPAERELKIKMKELLELAMKVTTKEKL